MLLPLHPTSYTVRSSIPLFIFSHWSMTQNGRAGRDEGVCQEKHGQRLAHGQGWGSGDFGDCHVPRQLDKPYIQGEPCEKNQPKH
jgi:hypothetical protein